MGVERYKQGDNKVGKGHPILYGFPEAEYFGPFPEGGGYPHGFLRRAFKIMGVTQPKYVLHVCSGSMQVGYCVDIRPSKSPSVVADACHLPFADSCFTWIMADPPYSDEYNRNLYGVEAHYPSPHVLAQECIRVLRPGGTFGFMHHMVPKVKRPGILLKVHTITQGMGYNVRAWSLFTKEG